MYVSTNDYKGNISLVIPTNGCNLKCGFCHNKELAGDTKPLKLIKIKDMILKNLDFIDSITVTGGEPLLHSGQLSELFQFAKKKGLKIKLDTNGSYPGHLKNLIKYIDYLALDVKTKKNKYGELTGSHIYPKVLKSLGIGNNSPNTFVECRTTYSSHYMSSNDLKLIAKDIKCDLFTLQQFRNRNTLNSNFQEIPNTTHDELLEVAKQIKPYFKNLEIRSAEFGIEKI